ncbi:MAG: tetratricopeptide repeat protein [Acidobacteriia bacterium]|nr:tetratricopeptide repeat protein [Terriglobia bacterium]
MAQRSLRSETRIHTWRGGLMRAVLVCLVAAWPAARARAQTPDNATVRYVVTRYTIDAELFPSTHTMAAKAKIELIPNTDLTALSFQLNSSLRVEKILDASGQQVSFKQDGQSLSLSLMNPLPEGKTSSLTVNYGGTLSTSEGSPVENLKLAYVGPEGSYLLYPGHWFPVSPNDLNRFAATMRISVPSEETVIASGKPLAQVRETGRVTYGFVYDQSSFPGTVLAGKYVVQPAALTGADIVFYMKLGHEQFVSSYGESAGKILSYYSDKFGPLPSSHLAIVEIEDGSVGGYTSPGIVALASRAFSNPVNYRLLAHELSHQWWRCLVSPATPNDAFLDEGLATYSAALYVEDTAGQAAFEDLMHEVEVGALTHETVAPVAQAGHLQPFTPEYQSIVFQKGAMVFHMLRWVLGDDAFFKSLKAMAQQYAGKSISTDAFQKLAETTSKQELTYFFAQWVNSTGVPQFKRTWAVYRTQKGYQVVGKLQQDLDLFRMPVEVRVECEGSRPAAQRVEMVGTTADFTVNTRTKPLRVIIDPASRLLKYDDTVKFQVEMAKGDQLVQQQAYLEAIKQYQQVLELNKNSSIAHYRLGETFFKLRNYNAAMEELRRALDGDLKPRWIEVWSHLMLGKIFDVTGQRDRAINEYQRALQTNDNTQGALDEANRYIQKPFSQQQSSQGR